MKLYEHISIGFMRILCGIILCICVNLELKYNTTDSIGSVFASVMTSTMEGEHISRIKRYSGCDLLTIGKGIIGKPNPRVITRLKQLHILQNKGNLFYRGSRGGKGTSRRLWDTNQGVNLNNLQTLPEQISTIITVPSIDRQFEARSNCDNLMKIKYSTSNVVKGQTNVKVCCLNPRSVKNKTLAISDYIISNNLDLLAVTETWLGTTVDKTCISELVPSYYQIKHVPRSGRRGGGVALIYKNSIDIKIVESSRDTRSQFSNFEFMDCNVTINGYSLRLAVIYRPPPTRENGFKTNDFLEQEWPVFLSRYTTIDKNILIVGDLNFHLDDPTNRDSARFASVLESCGLRQHVSEPTHVGGHTLDVVISRDTEDIVSNVEVNDPGLSDNSGKVARDHLAVTFSVKAARPAPIRKTVSFRKIRSISIESFKTDIQTSQTLADALNCTDLDELTNVYMDELSALVEKHAPLRTKTITLRSSNPWFTEELHDAKHLKRKLERQWRTTKLTIHHEIYRNQCALTNKLLKQARLSYYSDKVESCGRDQKSLFKVTKHLLGDSNETRLPSSQSPKALAQTFSDFFISKIETIRSDISSKNTTNEAHVEMSDQIQLETYLTDFTPTTHQEVKAIILKSPNKSCELDPIPTWLLKSCIDELLPVLTKIINSSLDSAYVPKSFKRSRIRPLIKKPSLDQNTLKNYRPVSNLPFISKVLEKVVDKRVEQHLSQNNLHEKHQSAYRKFHSTETALLKLQSDILQSLDHNKVTVLVLLYLSAAFDTIDHSTLLNCLERDFGIAGKPLAWMTSYLSDRYQTVCIDGELSTPVLMNFSVPQGSVLGPKNYVMYTKPVGEICRKHGLNHHFYADDSQLYLSFDPVDNTSQTSILQRVESCLNDIVSWMNQNMLKLNADKTELILFSSKHNAGRISDVTVKVGDSIIKPTSCVKNLGAFLDSRMDMEQHINAVCRLCYAQLRQIGHIRPYLTCNATKTLVNSLVTSRLDYCNSLLSGLPKSTLNKLQTVQNTAARIITKTSRFDHISPVLKELHWLPVKIRIDFKILIYVYKTIHNQAPSYIKEMLTVYTPPRVLRSQSDTLAFSVPRSRTVRYGDRSFPIIAPKLWNALPAEIRNCNSLESFKRSLKTHFFLQTYCD